MKPAISAASAVHWQGSFLLTAGQTGTLAMALMADDDAWVFVNGLLALDHGGVKALNASGPIFNGVVLNEGVNTLDIFYADRHTVQAGLVFNTALQIVPARAGAALAAVCGLGARRRRRN